MGGMSLKLTPIVVSVTLLRLLRLSGPIADASWTHIATLHRKNMALPDAS